MVVRTALVIDDSKSARLLLLKTLEKFQIRADTCASVQEALALLDQKQPDIIFIDYMMNEINGVEAIPLIKKKKSCSNIPIVVCSSHEDPEYRFQALTHGAFDFLPKPCSPRYLANVLQKITPIFETQLKQSAHEHLVFNDDADNQDQTWHEALKKLSQLKQENSHHKLQTLLDERLSHLRRVLLLEIENSVEHALHKALNQFESNVDSIIEDRIINHTKSINTTLNDSSMDTLISTKLHAIKMELSRTLKESLTEIKQAFQKDNSTSSNKLLVDVKNLARITASHYATISAGKAVRESTSNIQTISSEQLQKTTQETLQHISQQLEPKVNFAQKISIAAALISMAVLISTYFMSIH